MVDKRGVWAYLVAYLKAVYMLAVLLDLRLHLRQAQLGQRDSQAIPIAALEWLLACLLTKLYPVHLFEQQASQAWS